MGLLAGLGAVAGLFFVFLKIWSEVVERDARAIDDRILLSLRQPGHPAVPIGPAWATQCMLDLSSLGGGTLLGLVVVATSGYLIVKGARTRALWLVTATISGSILLLFLKSFFGRPRPQIVDHLVTVQSMSFPSGHATNSALVYLTIAALASDVEPSSVGRIYIMAIAIIMTILVGLSRLYLGVHWPSDVAAGWALGAGWALAWRLVADYFGKRTAAGNSISLISSSKNTAMSMD